jgi:cytochrome c oxidase assembly protein subunit 15
MAKEYLLNRDQNAVLAWLMVCMLLVAAMVTLGGYTRLSGAGLSITQWKPIHGTLPPSGQAQWEEEFSAYKQTPQFQKVNSSMTLEEFKEIYWPEYFHRLLGRLVGIALLVPFIIFLARGSLSRHVAMHVGGIFLMGALQGFIGWFMVMSGLVDNPRVSHVRLALHLTMAFAIFGLIEWLWLDLMAEHEWWKKTPHSEAITSRYDPLSLYVIWLFFYGLQVLFGAFLAGLHGGFVYNTWPTMNGKFLPDSFAGDIELVQFIHRWLAAMVVGGFVLWWCLCAEYAKNIHLTKACAAIASLLGLQFLLGVLTLINVVPLHLALAHQLGALALFASALYLLHKLVAEVKE